MKRKEAHHTPNSILLPWKTKSIKIRYLPFGKNGNKEKKNTKILPFGGTTAKNLFED